MKYRAGKQGLKVLIAGSFSCESECAEGFFMNEKGQCEGLSMIFKKKFFLLLHF